MSKRKDIKRTAAEVAKELKEAIGLGVASVDKQTDKNAWHDFATALTTLSHKYARNIVGTITYDARTGHKETQKASGFEETYLRDGKPIKSPGALPQFDSDLRRLIDKARQIPKEREQIAALVTEFGEMAKEGKGGNPELYHNMISSIEEIVESESKKQQSKESKLGESKDTKNEEALARIRAARDQEEAEERVRRGSRASSRNEQEIADRLSEELARLTREREEAERRAKLMDSAIDYGRLNAGLGHDLSQSSELERLRAENNALQAQLKAGDPDEFEKRRLLELDLAKETQKREQAERALHDESEAHQHSMHTQSLSQKAERLLAEKEGELWKRKYESEQQQRNADNAQKDSELQELRRLLAVQKTAHDSDKDKNQQLTTENSNKDLELRDLKRNLTLEKDAHNATKDKNQQLTDELEAQRIRNEGEKKRLHGKIEVMERELKEAGDFRADNKDLKEALEEAAKNMDRLDKDRIAAEARTKDAREQAAKNEGAAAKTIADLQAELKTLRADHTTVSARYTQSEKELNYARKELYKTVDQLRAHSNLPPAYKGKY
jgi:hypothetical protein